MEHLMEIMTTGTETFCIVLLLNTFFERKYTSYRFFFPLSAAFLFYLWLPLNTILATSFVTKLFISILIWLVFSQIFYTGALPFHLFLLCSFFIILSGLDYFTLLGISYIFSFSFSDALSNSALYILGAFVSRTLLLLFSIIIYRLFKAKTSMILSSSTWIALLLFPVFSILLFGVTIESAMAQNKISFNLILSGIGLLLFNISLFLLLGKLEYSTSLQQKNIALQHEIDQNMKSTNALQAIFNEQRALTHDFNNHITTLYMLLKAGHYEKATEYVKVLSQNLPENTRVVSTNHPILDTILNQKYTQAKLQNTSMRFTVNDLSSFPMKDEDVVTLLGNLLDNALEACRKLPDSSYINVKILKKEEDFLLSVENSSLPVKISENNYVPTDKTEPHLHGFGLQNIAHIMQKYGYEYTLFYHDARFHFVSILS